MAAEAEAGAEAGTEAGAGAGAGRSYRQKEISNSCPGHFSMPAVCPLSTHHTPLPPPPPPVAVAAVAARHSPCIMQTQFSLHTFWRRLNKLDAIFVCARQDRERERSASVVVEAVQCLSVCWCVFWCVCCCVFACLYVCLFAGLIMLTERNA